MKLSFGVLFIGIHSIVISQSVFQLNVRVLDNNQSPQDAVIVNLMKSDSSFIKTALSNVDGTAEFEDIKEGNYYIYINDFVFEKYWSSLVSVTGATEQIHLEPIQLQTKSHQLKEVTIQAQKPFIERKADRMVVNVENSIVSTGSTALEVLERSPGVRVNQESGINLKGKSGVTVMIDGKPTPLSGADLIAYLKSMPSSNLERIDLITNPSAKYDAAGNAGIIDLRLKKDKRDGYNGSIGLNFGQGVYAKPSANGSINYRNKKWNIYTTQAINAPRSFTDFYINRKFFQNGDGPLESVFDQNTFTRQPQTSYNSRLSLDYYATQNTIWGIMLNSTFYQGNRDGTSHALITEPTGALLYTNETKNLLNDKRYNLHANANFKSTLAKSGTEISGDFDIGKYHARPYQDIYIDLFDAANKPLESRTQNSDQLGQINIRSLKFDISRPYKNKAKLEAGIKSSNVMTDNDLKFFNVLQTAYHLDATRSNHFVYDETIHAIYTNYNKEFKSSSVQMGLRIENTRTTGNQLTTGEKLSRNYTQLFPSIAISQKINDKNDVSISYSRRIDRPTYRQLNPFKILVDNYTYVSGDPYLFPVLTNSVQVGYTLFSKYNFTASFVQSKDVITDVFVQDDQTKISTQVPANLQNFQQFDFTANFPVSIKNWMNSNLTISTNSNNYSSPLQNGQLKNNFNAWDFSVNNGFILGKKGWTAELNSFYQSKNAWGQFIIRNLAQVSVGIQKVSSNKKHTYKLAAADLFRTNHIAVIVKYQNQDWHTDRRWDSRFVTLSYTYRFGKSTVARARSHSSGVEDEKRRSSGA